MEDVGCYFMEDDIPSGLEMAMLKCFMQEQVCRKTQYRID